MSEPGPMETIRSALARLEASGFRDSFEAVSEGFVPVGRDELYEPEDLVVDEVVRFEGESDPDSEAIVLALSSRNGAVRGTFVSGFGRNADPVAAELMRRLDDGDRSR